MQSVLEIPAAPYAPHALHDEERSWPETNCYVDLWIEVLHAQRLEPTAALAFTLALDFEGDQHTFFKFPLEDLHALYGIEVQELNVWRSLTAHAVEQCALGRLFMPEVDSFHLPDTAGVSYRLAHQKSSIAIESIDVESRTLRYFHNRGLHTLSGEDFDGVMRVGSHAPADGVLPPYAEIAKLDRVKRLGQAELAERAVALTIAHLARRPRRNPIAAFGERLTTDLPWLIGESMEFFHQYAFATVRQAGACFGLTASYLRWLDDNGERGLSEAAGCFEAISNGAKSLQFALARAARLKRPIDPSSTIDTMARGWDEGMTRLVDYFGD